MAEIVKLSSVRSSIEGNCASIGRSDVPELNFMSPFIPLSPEPGYIGAVRAAASLAGIRTMTMLPRKTCFLMFWNITAADAELPGIRSPGCGIMFEKTLCFAANFDSQAPVAGSAVLPWLAARRERGRLNSAARRGGAARRIEPGRLHGAARRGGAARGGPVWR